MKEPKVKRWTGTKPVKCQICNEALTLENGHVYFCDFKTRDGLWAIGCIKCFQKQGGHIGVGYGQKYRLGDLTQVTGK